MKYIRAFFALTAALILFSSFSFFKPREKSVYAFGLAASFRDTIVYYTEIQKLDSVTLKGDGFLPDRDLYSYQLKNYLEFDMNKPNYTCMIYFSNNKVKLEKTALKIKEKYTKKDRGMTLQQLDATAFRFKKPED